VGQPNFNSVSFLFGQMNWNRKPVRPPQDPKRPTTLVVKGLAELQAAVARADQLVKRNGVWEHGRRGEYRINAMIHLGAVTSNNKNGRYELELTWHEPKQQDLL